MDLTSKGWCESLQTPDGAKLRSVTSNTLTLGLNTNFPPNCFALPKVSFPRPLPHPRILLHLQAHFEYLNFVKRTRSACGCAHARALTPSLEYTSRLGRLPVTEHILPFFALGHTPSQWGLVGPTPPRRR